MPKPLSQTQPPSPEPDAPATDGAATGDSAAKPDPFAALMALDSASATDEQIEEAVNEYVGAAALAQPTLAGYNVVILYDDRTLDRSDADRIYQTLAEVDRAKPILLVLRSPGGDIAAAYFIGKLCREYTDGTFEVAVPREAKSAATLVCCGADVIHMGSLSELGPIDPQFGGMPALAVKHSLEHIAEIVTRHPAAREMLSDYLAKALPVNIVGHFERAAGSAAQYAERLLSARRKNRGANTNGEIARRLVYEYKDHGFAIDAREAMGIFGGDMVKTDTQEYKAANQVYEEIGFAEWLVRRRFKRNLWFTGSTNKGCRVKAIRDAKPA